MESTLALPLQDVGVCSPVWLQVKVVHMCVRVSSVLLFYIFVESDDLREEAAAQSGCEGPDTLVPLSR